MAGVSLHTRKRKKNVEKARKSKLPRTQRESSPLTELSDTEEGHSTDSQSEEPTTGPTRNSYNIGAIPTTGHGSWMGRHLREADRVIRNLQQRNAQLQRTAAEKTKELDALKVQFSREREALGAAMKREAEYKEMEL